MKITCFVCGLVKMDEYSQDWIVIPTPSSPDQAYICKHCSVARCDICNCKLVYKPYGTWFCRFPKYYCTDCKN